MKLILILTSIVLSQTALATNCKTNPIYCKITSLNKSVNRDFAMNVSNYLYKYSKEFGTDPFISVAIAMQETSFRNINRVSTLLVEPGIYSEGISDIGLFQIHIDTAKNLNIDPYLLLNSLEYQVYWHVKLLAKKIKVCKQKRVKLKVKIGEEWSCYHSYTNSKRTKYYKDVLRWL